MIDGGGDGDSKIRFCFWDGEIGKELCCRSEQRVSGRETIVGTDRALVLLVLSWEVGYNSG